MKTLYINGGFFGVFTDITIEDSCIVADKVKLPFSVVGNAYEVVEGAFYPKVPIAIEVPQVITDLQAYLALIELGLLEDLKAYADANPTFNVWFDRALTWERNHPILADSAKAFGFTDEQLDNLFIIGATK